MSDDLFLDIYYDALQNAVDLNDAAELLHESRKYAQAYALAYTALEEVSKSQFAADVSTGIRSEQEFKDFFQSHRKKLENIDWAHAEADYIGMRWFGPDIDDINSIILKHPEFRDRLRALYVDVDFTNKTISKPSNEISENISKGIIHIVNEALKKILITTEFWGHQIGSKGFMK
jgi:AbiV family abortive infection protein